MLACEISRQLSLLRGLQLYECSGFKFSQLEMSAHPSMESLTSHTDMIAPAMVEVVLYMLLASFNFERCEVPIVWNFAGTSYPTISKESSKPEMYLKVGLVSG